MPRSDTREERNVHFGRRAVLKACAGALGVGWALTVLWDSLQPVLHRSEPAGPLYQPWLMNVSASGHERWSRILPTELGNVAPTTILDVTSATGLGDDGYLLAGYIFLFGDEIVAHPWILKTDRAGREQWHRVVTETAVNPDPDNPPRVFVSVGQDGTYRLISHVNWYPDSPSVTGGWSEVTSTTVSQEGAAISTQPIYSSKRDSDLAGMETVLTQLHAQATGPGGDVRISGVGSGTNSDYDEDGTLIQSVHTNKIWLLKLNGAGDTEWNVGVNVAGQIDGERLHGSNPTVLLTDSQDGGCLLAVQIAGYDDDGVFGLTVLVSIDSEGEEEWARTIGGDDRRLVTAIATTADGYVFTERRGTWLHLTKIGLDGREEGSRQLVGCLDTSAFTITDLGDVVVLGSFEPGDQESSPASFPVGESALVALSDDPERRWRVSIDEFPSGMLEEADGFCVFGVSRRT